MKLLTHSLLAAAVLMTLAGNVQAAHTVFTSSLLASDGSNVDNSGNLLYAYNLEDQYGPDGFVNTTLNGVTFVAEDPFTSPVANFSIANSGGFDSTNNAGGGVALVSGDTLFDLQQRGAYNNLTLTLNNLLVGETYQVQLMIGEQTGDSRYQQYVDGALASPVVVGYNGPAYIMETFTATSTSKILVAQYGGGGGAQLTGFEVREVPEPSTYALMIGGLAFLAFCVRRKGALVK